MLCCNFDVKSAVFATFDYADEHLPDSRRGVQQDMRKLIGKSRDAFRLAGLDFPVIYTVEGQPRVGLPHADSQWEVAPWKDRRRWAALDPKAELPLEQDTARLHAHAFMILPTKEDLALIRSFWTHGKVYLNYIRVNDFESFRRLAAYVTKESRQGIRPPGERSYIPSLGLARPQFDSHWAEEGEDISFPDRAEKLYDDSHDDYVSGRRVRFIAYRFPRKNRAAPKPYRSKGRISENQKAAKIK